MCIRDSGAIASYDFSSDLRNFQWGAQLGVDWKAFKHLKVYADLNWGMNDIFNKDFKTITFDMYAAVSYTHLDVYNRQPLHIPRST